jgi:hypothetical protein
MKGLSLAKGSLAFSKSFLCGEGGAPLPLSPPPHQRKFSCFTDDPKAHEQLS